jgi:hypothetical protein
MQPPFTTEYAEDAEEHREWNEITRDIISAAMKVHSKLGPGLLESAYVPAVMKRFF